MAHGIREEFDAPNQGAAGVSYDIAQAFSTLLNGLDKVLAPSRERSLVVTRLQEAHYWAQMAEQKP